MNKLLLLIMLIPMTAFSQSAFQLTDGSEIQAYFETPDTAQGASKHPLVIIMGGGPGSERIANSAFNNHGSEFVQRGWAVAAPISPNGQSFWGSNAEKVRELIALLKKRDDVEEGPVLLMGVSNGGISSLEIASRHPQEYLGVIAVPALASNASAMAALEDFPIFLRIGSEDRLGWGDRYDDTAALLTGVGAKLNGRLLQGIGHTFPLDWAEVEPWLGTLSAR